MVNRAQITRISGLAAALAVVMAGCGRQEPRAYEATPSPRVAAPTTAPVRPATPVPNVKEAIATVEDALKNLKAVLSDSKLDSATAISDETSATIMGAAKRAGVSMEVYWGKFAEDGAVSLSALEKSVVSAAAAQTSESRKGHLDFARKMLSQLEVRAERMRNAAAGAKPKND
jgi:hypothetical protein